MVLFFAREGACPSRPSGYGTTSYARWVARPKTSKRRFWSQRNRPKQGVGGAESTEATGDDYATVEGCVRTLLSSPSNQIPSPQPKKENTPSWCVFSFLLTRVAEGFEPHDLRPFEHASRSTKGGYSPCSQNARVTANVIIAKRDPYRHYVAVYCQLGATKAHLAHTI